jgi:thiol-disulfide isomerase/thioredoxin
MKRFLHYTIATLISFGLWNCQPVLKAPAATIYSATLPTPEIDSIKNTEQLPDADFNLQVKTLDGQFVNMEDSRGKVIFLNFWATWCMPCVAELPSIDKLYNQFKNDNIVFLLISNEKTEKVQSYKTRKGYDVPFVIQDSTSKIPRMYYSRSIPTTFIINKEGKVVKASVGAENWDNKEFVETIKKML